MHSTVASFLRSTNKLNGYGHKYPKAYNPLQDPGQHQLMLLDPRSS